MFYFSQIFQNKHKKKKFLIYLKFKNNLRKLNLRKQSQKAKEILELLQMNFKTHLIFWNLKIMIQMEKN